ncbi:hypothetical protein FRX31_029983 [Thalictrum thalictroides]|uniref:Uncharacterized protein n=1 Tax=Thalictrum thalictroides TaxID=46969 RepID=A0A7J6V8A8_THATH|nr:hypothetical protein FRX31_029983 [Thalictrum thalictroides]
MTSKVGSEIEKKSEISLFKNGLKLQAWNRFMSSHGDDHLDKQQVIDRVLFVVKSFPKVDPNLVLVRKRKGEREELRGLGA